MARIFNSNTECLNEVQRLKHLQKQHPLRPEVIPSELAHSSRWIVWAYEVGRRKNGKFGLTKIAYQAKNPRLKSSRWIASDWSDLATALKCAKDNPHIDGIGYFFSKHDGLTGIDFDNCRDPKTGRIRKEYQFWINQLNGYTEVSPSATGIKVWVKGTIDSKYFRNDESTGFRIPNFADGIIEIYRRGQYFTVTTQTLEGFEHIKPAQEVLDILSEFSHLPTRNTLSGGWVSGAHRPNVAANLPEGAKIRLGKGSINDIQFSPDSTQLAVASSIGVWIYDTNTGEGLNLLSGHRSSVSSIAYSPNGHLLASVGRDDTLRLWDAKCSSPLGSLRINAFQPSGVYRVAFQSDGHILVSGGCTNPIFEGVQMIREESGAFLQTVELIFENEASLRLTSAEHKTLQHRSFAGIVVFSSNGFRLATGSKDGTVRLWDTEKGELLETLNMPQPESVIHSNQALENLAFCSDGRILAGGGDWGSWLWDVERRETLKTFLEFSGGGYSVSFSPDGHLFARSSGFNKVCLWDVTTGKSLRTFPHENVENVHVTSLTFSPDGSTLAGGSQAGTILLWDVDIAKGSSTPATVLIEQPVLTADIAPGEIGSCRTEKNTEPQNRESQIRQICTEFSITTLVHFTRIENLQSILQEGLIGRATLEAQRRQFLFTDNDRADWLPEANCLSISFPNYQMFYKVREEKKSEGVNYSQWIVLLFDAKVLWELECAFCQRNAAHKTVRSIPVEDRQNPDALKGMFEDFYNTRHQDLSIPQNYPTHPQAEVLVFNPIPMRYIKAIHFWDLDAQERWLPNSTGADYETSCTNRRYFLPRYDYEVWSPANFNREGYPLSYR